MENTFIIADLCLCDSEVALKRGFKDDVEHDAFILKQWNNTVSKEDVVYLLGRVADGRPDSIKKFNSLNGVKRIALSDNNHPTFIRKTIKKARSVCGTFTYDIIAVNDNDAANGLDSCNELINVSCDVVNYTPVRIQVFAHKPEE